MITTLAPAELHTYISKQLEHFYPDSSEPLELNVVDLALDKLNFCFSRINLKYYHKSSDCYFNHLNSDHYAVFIYYCSNIAYQLGLVQLASKLFYLNKTLNAFHCMYDTKLPDVFMVLHGVGTVLGKANYGNYFVCYQGCTVGANAELEYPTIGDYTIMYPNSSIIGSSITGNRSCISNGAFVNDAIVPDNSLVYGRSPNLAISQDKKERFDLYFK